MKSEKAHTAHPKRRIVLGVLLAFIVILIVLAAWQWDNISAFLVGVGNSQEEIDKKIEENQQNFDNVADEYAISDKNITDEDLAQLDSGEKTVDDIAENIIDPSGAKADTDDEVQKLVASLYVIRSKYSSRISGLMSSAKSEFDALPAEQRTATAKRRIVANKISEASALESACDAEVSSAVSKLRSKLAETGQSTSLADEIMSTYESEKQLRKANYISMYT